MASRAIYPVAAALVVALSFAASSPVGAQYCEGTVHGLSRHYDLDMGSGFLAVRARPNSSSRMIGQLFNGDHAEIFDRRGNWYQIDFKGRTGWANARWLRNDCGY